MTLSWTSWCLAVRWASRLLEGEAVGYQWVDIDPCAEGKHLVRQVNDGDLSVPTLLPSDGSTLTELSPSDLIGKRAGWDWPLPG